MKYIVCLFGLLISSLSIAQLNWSAEYAVADGSVYGKNWPRIALSNGVPLVTWGDGSSDKQYVARWTGTGFDTPVEMSLPGMEVFAAGWAGANIAAKGSDVFVVFKELPAQTGKVYTRKSVDGGITWGDTVRADNLSGGEFARFPFITIKDDGNPIVMWMYHDNAGMNTKYMTVTSVDGGLSYSTEVNASNLAPGGEVCDCCPASIFSKNGHTVGLFRNNNNNLRDMWMTYSGNGGNAFSNAIDIDTTDWNLSTCPSSGTDGYITNNRLYAVFMSGASLPTKTYISEIDLSTQTLINNSVPVANSVPSGATQNFPQIAGSGDTLGIVWEQNYSGNVETVFTYSINGIAGLSGTYDTVAIDNYLAESKPDIAYDPQTQIFHFVYSDQVTGNVVYRQAGFGSLGLNEERDHPKFVLFPNPVNGDHINIETSSLSDNVEVLIVDITGKTVGSYSFSGRSLQIPIEQLDNGVYLLRCTQNGIISTERLVIQGH